MLEKAQEDSAVHENYRPMRNADGRRTSLPQGKQHQLVILYLMPSNIIQTEQIVLMNLGKLLGYVYTHACS